MLLTETRSASSVAFRRNEPHHIAAHDGFRPALFGELRVLKLFGHRDAKALADELLKIVVGARDRHPAHGDVLAGMFAALRKLDAERIRGRDRVVEEQLKEIAHAVEEQKFRVLGLHLKVLRHHGRGAFASLAFSRASLFCLIDDTSPSLDSYRQAGQFTRRGFKEKAARKVIPARALKLPCNLYGLD